MAAATADAADADAVSRSMVGKEVVDVGSPSAVERVGAVANSFLFSRESHPERGGFFVMKYLDYA